AGVHELGAQDALSREIRPEAGGRARPTVSRADVQVEVLALEIIVDLVRVGVEPDSRLQRDLAPLPGVTQLHTAVEQHTGRRVILELLRVDAALVRILAEPWIVVRLDLEANIRDRFPIAPRHERRKACGNGAHVTGA